MKRYKRALFYDISGDKAFHINLYKNAWGEPCISFEGEWQAVAYSEEYQAWVFKKYTEGLEE